MYDLTKCKAHPHAAKVVAELEAYFQGESWKEPTTERRIEAIDKMAQLIALTGREPVNIRVDVLRAFRNEPRLFTNANHMLTWKWLHLGARAAALWPLAKAELAPWLRYGESRMLDGSLVGTNLFVTLAAIAKIRWVLYGKASAADIVRTGFGSTAHQWGLPQLTRDAFDAEGYPRFDTGRIGHQLWCSRPAAVWLYRNFDGQIPAGFYALPWRLLLPGGKLPMFASPEFPDFNDGYRTDQALGPIGAWPYKDDAGKRFRNQIRQYATPDIDWLTVPDDAGYVAQEPLWQSNRKLAGYDIATVNGVTRVTYVCYTPEVTTQRLRSQVPVTIEVKI